MRTSYHFFPGVFFVKASMMKNGYIFSAIVDIEGGMWRSPGRFEDHFISNRKKLTSESP